MNHMEKRTPQAPATGRHICDLAKLGRSKQRPCQDLWPQAISCARRLATRLRLPKRARVANLFAVVCGVDLYGAAHLIQTRTNSFADALGKRIFNRRRAHARDA